MNFIFKIHKLRALERLHKEHIERSQMWLRSVNSCKSPENIDKCWGQYEAAMKEAYKIENLIKFL